MTARMHRNSRQAGLSMIELMIAIAIGLLILAGLVTIFANASNTQHELRRTAQQIETGRYAMDVLTRDLQLAGFWGQFRYYTTPAALPDPCLFTDTDLTNAIGLSVQGYQAPALNAKPVPPAACSTWIPTANLSDGSDILVVRRASTDFVTSGTVTTAGDTYIQNNPSEIAVQSGGGTVSCTSTASGTVATILRRCAVPSAVDVCTATCPTNPGGYIRKYEVHVYFVAPCNVPTGGGNVCTGASDDSGRPIPTLKRLELANVGGARSFRVVPLAEGVEFMKIAYGIDDTPATVNTETELVGDGSPDRYMLAPTLTDFSNAVTVRVDLLVRNPEPSSDYVDPKTYQLSVDPAAPANAAYTIVPAQTNYRRHVYSSEVRLVNLSARKEIP
ncbi:MAG: hypothetical protein A3I63_09575 [Betaproteobacteria bacterium RIFCSPLOWO2_02_FULL_66_14]|nr:MAG: hypothetical protein A3I63_09575 [Betaproteobacteria bacterium RIFCSPLOWO2_02_FULL_66_14]